MSIPKICGLETEYGLMASDPQKLRQEEAAFALLHRCPLEPKVPWDMSGESPQRDARHDSGEAERQPPSLSATDHPGYMLGNGARLYVDHGHPEYATPECTNALALVACDKAGELLLERCRREVNRFLSVGQSIRLFKNNSDHQGHSYGCHENYLVAADVYQALFRERIKDLYAYLVPFLVSRQVICGAGKVGSENGQPAVDFQISQRADFFETVIGLETMSQRPIVNTRDEPHADRSRFRRLHVITGDANMSEVSTYLKVGTMQIFLAMLEDGARMDDLTLADPVAAMVQISHDPTCRQTVPLAHGRRLTAVEMQMCFAEAAQHYVDTVVGARQYASILQRWIEMLQELGKDPLQLCCTLDWIIKWDFLRDWQTRKNVTWSASELKELDIRYHDIDRENGIFYLLQSSGRIDRVVDNQQVNRAIDEPLSDTRAVIRAERVKQCASRMHSVSWAAIVDYDGRGGLVRETLEDPVLEIETSLEGQRQPDIGMLDI